MNRAGLAARDVTFTHWGFVVWGGLCCLVFLRTEGLARAFVPLLVVPVQLGWTAFVFRRARLAAVGRW